MANEHVAEPFRSILEAATAGVMTPAELHAQIRNKALEEAAEHLDAMVDEGAAPITYSHAAQAIRALKAPGAA